MKFRDYLSNLSPWWTFERQEALLGTPSPTVFRDELSRRARRGQNAVMLVQRNAMLRATTRAVAGGETVRVASLAVLAETEADLLGVLVALAGRGSALHVIEADQVFEEPFGRPHMIVGEWKAARDRSRQEGAARRGGQVTKARIEPAFIAKVQKYADRWGNPAWTREEVVAAMGVSVNTAVKHMRCTWGEALRRNRARLKRQSKKREGAQEG